jgi:phosphonate transport system substrate-binding protein
MGWITGIIKQLPEREKTFIFLEEKTMRKVRPLYFAMVIVIVASLVLAACTPETIVETVEVMVVETVEVEKEVVKTVEVEVVKEVEVVVTATPEPMPEIGTDAHPIKVLFVPSVDANVIVTGGDVMAQALKDATGLNFEVSVPTSYAATIEEMCASPADTMAFIPAFGYVLANDLCGVDVAFKAVRRGWGVYWTMIVVARDSDIQSIADLEGKKWAYPDAGSTSGYLVPVVMLQEAGVTVGETLEAGGHPQAVRAVYTGEADFGTAFYSPWAAPEGAAAWARGEDPEVPVDPTTCALNDDASQLLCEGYRVLDARANIREEFPDVVEKVRILSLSPDIPNDTLSFGPEFPAAVRAQIEAALIAFAETEEWGLSLGSEDFYGWSGLEAATDAEYDFIRLMVTTSGITLETLE